MPKLPTASRRRFLSLLLSPMMLTSTGCSSLWKNADEAEREARLAELMDVPEPPQWIGDASAPFGMRPLEVDGVGAVNQLPGTGGPADPSPYRESLIEEMKRHDVVDPNHFLESTETALVRVRATIPPGAQRGDPLDLRVLAPAESRASNLHHGWLLDTRLRQQQVIQNRVKQSDVLAIGVGPVLTRADYSAGDDSTMNLEGNVLSGGRVQVSRKLGLVLKPEFQHAKTANLLSDSINRRFFFFDGTTRRGISKPLEDDYIEIDVHPRYRNNLQRMIQVVLSIRGDASSVDMQSQLAELSDQLREPARARDASLKLEAIGESAVPTLISALDSDDEELRFYAAEALAYLDRTEAIEPLQRAARDEPAFRYWALLALEGLDDHQALESLQALLQEPSLETRYGAFVATRRRPDSASVVVGDPVGPYFLYRVNSVAPPAVIVSLRESPEIVLMGATGSMQISSFLRAGGLMLTPSRTTTGAIRISNYQAGKEDQKIEVPSDLGSVIRGIAKTGGSYGDVITVLRMAKDKGFMSDQLAIDPYPKKVRTYYREEEAEYDQDDE
ncbi:MAG: flagellar basal body P-ring protein FlgI [Planctomycetota bacterium]